MAKPDKAESTSTAAESKSSGATSSTANKATPIDTSSKPDGYKSLSDVDKAYIDSILESQKNPGQVYHAPAYDEAANKATDRDRKLTDRFTFSKKQYNTINDSINDIVNNRDKDPEAYNNLKKDLDTLSYLTNPDSEYFDDSNAQYKRNRDDYQSPLFKDITDEDDYFFKSAFQDFIDSKKGGLFRKVNKDQVLKDYAIGVERKTYKAPETVQAPKVPTTVEALKVPTTVQAPKGLTADDIKNRFGNDAAAAAEWMKNNPGYKPGPATEKYMNDLGYTKGEDGSFTENTVSRNRYDPLKVDFSGLKSGASNVFGEMSRGPTNLGGTTINKVPTDIITKKLPKSDSIESSDNSSYNSNNPSPGGYTNNSVSNAADKQYRRVSRNNESIGLADDPNRANYNDDWNRGMTDKSTDVVSDENKKTFIKKIIKRDPLNRTITKKIISKRGM